MTGPLLDDLLDQLRGGPVQQLAGHLGLPHDATLNAVGTALPVLLGALHRNAQGDGAASLLSALETDHRGVDPGNALSTALAGGTRSDGILAHVLGEHRGPAARAVGESSGIGESRAGELLNALAPVVMAYLARRTFTPRNADGASTPHPSPDGLRAALENEIAALHARSGATSEAELDGDDSATHADIDPAALPVQTAEMRSPRPRI